jgi:hypothetical protein
VATRVPTGRVCTQLRGHTGECSFEYELGIPNPGRKEFIFDDPLEMRCHRNEMNTIEMFREESFVRAPYIPVYVGKFQYTNGTTCHCYRTGITCKGCEERRNK